MARTRRINYPGALHHIMNRGARKAPVFGDLHSKRVFVKRLRALPERFNVEIQAWVLMPNHYHLVLRSTASTVSPAMKWLGQTITHELNVQPDWDGPVFRGRYRNRVVQSDAYHAHLFAYLHLNPVPGLARDAHHWPWSSAQALLGLVPVPDWLSTYGMTRRFGSAEALKDYTDRVRLGRLDAPGTFREDVLWGGRDTGFAERIPTETLVRCVTQVARHASVRERNQLTAATLVHVGRLTQDEVAHRLGVSRSTVRRAVGRHAASLRPGQALRTVLDSMLANG